MGRPGRWTFVAFLYLSCQEALCQKKRSMLRENVEGLSTKLSGNPSSTDLYNSILTTAASNGVLSDLLPKLNNQPIVESLSKCPYTQDMLAKPLSVVPMTSSIQTQEPIIFSSQPLRQSSLNQNVLLATPLSYGSSYTSSAIPQTISTPSLPSSNCVSQIAQALPLDYPVYGSNVGVVQPKPIALQPQSQCNEINAYFYNPIAEQTTPDVGSNLCNLSVQTLPPFNGGSGLLEITSNLGLPCLSSATVLTNDYQETPLPISVPTPSLPVPKITVVPATPSNPPVLPPQLGYPEFATSLPPYQYPPQPPIVIERSKSSWKKWLPILLVALLSDRGCNDNCGCSCSSCNCGGNKTPIPFPIPIPINNPVINGVSTCRNRDKYDIEDDDYRKRK